MPFSTVTKFVEHHLKLFSQCHHLLMSSTAEQPRWMLRPKIKLRVLNSFRQSVIDLVMKSTAISYKWLHSVLIWGLSIGSLLQLLHTEHHIRPVSCDQHCLFVNKLFWTELSFVYFIHFYEYLQRKKLSLYLSPMRVWASFSIPQRVQSLVESHRLSQP